jgi:hypothetical protein
MILTLRFSDLPPMPRNRSHMLTVKSGRPMNIKTPLCRSFESDLESRMKEFKSQCLSFKESFNPDKNYISAEYYIFTPRSSLFTLKNQISSKSVDLDAHKVLQDTIFRSINLDDKLIRDVKYFSPISHDDKWNYVIIYKLENLCNLENMFTSIQSITKLMNNDSTSSALL